MQRFHNKRRVDFSPKQMFDLVAKVEDYPQFLPMCDRLQVRSREPTGAGEVIVADMSVGYGPVNETFTSKVTLDPTAKKVLVEYLDGPFRHLENRWAFEPVEHSQLSVSGAASGGCIVDFYLEYEFRSRMLQMLMGAMFDTAFRKFADAFETRARHVYAGGAARSSVV